MNELFRKTDPDDRTDVEILEADQSTPAEAQAAFEVETRIKGYVRDMRSLWVKLAEDLYRFHELDMWRDLGYRTFDQWLAGPDVDLARRTVFGLIEVWRELVINRGVKPGELHDVPISKLRDALPAVRRGFIDPQDALSDCRTLGRDDLRQRYAEVGTAQGARRDPAGTLPSSSSTAASASNGAEPEPSGGSGAFDATAEPEYAICPTCGSRYRVSSS